MTKKNEWIADFGETLDFSFVREDKWCYPQVSLQGAEGTSATLQGQTMSPAEIEALGLALVKYASKLKTDIVRSKL